MRTSPATTCRWSILPGAAEAVEFLAQRLGATSPAPSQPEAAGEARFLRGEAWQAARPRSLTREGVFLATSAAPSFGSRVELQLSLGDVVFLTRADVLHVTPPATGEALGWGGFGVRFVIETPEQTAALEALLKAAHGTALVTSAQPPRRAESRYPIEWPALIWNNKRCAEVLVLDVSRHGVFVNAEKLPPRDFELALAPAVEIGKEPIQMVTRIARRVTAQVAETRALTRGFGLQIVSFSSGSETRFARFVERVARRVGQTILIGASLSRMSELCVTFAASGYTTLGATDARGLLAKAKSAARPPSLVVLDPSLPPRPEVVEAVQALQRGGIRVLELEDDAIAAAQKQIDDLLLGSATPSALPR